MFKNENKVEHQARINASRVMERLERMNILGGQNNESVKIKNKSFEYFIKK